MKKLFIWFVFCAVCECFPYPANLECYASNNCTLPKCRCMGIDIPGGYTRIETPQMVVITFDDATNWENWDYYRYLFPPDGSRVNPNGCPIAMTLFVSNNYTDYCMVKKLHARGMEIADHSYTHRIPRLWWANATKEELAYEILTQRQTLATRAGIPISDIRGWRSPYLQPGEDKVFEILSENNFTFDATISHPLPLDSYSQVIWPFTLDYRFNTVCHIDPCPAKTYPGFWLLPVVIVMDYREEKYCVYVDSCENPPKNIEESFHLLWKNFLRNYRTNRAPFHVNLHSSWFNQDFNLKAMDKFIKQLLTMDDVYITTVTKSLEWIKHPTPLSQLKDFDPWKCNYKSNQEDDVICEMTTDPKKLRFRLLPTSKESALSFVFCVTVVTLTIKYYKKICWLAISGFNTGNWELGGMDDKEA